MLTSFSIGTLFGIKIRVHAMFLLMPFIFLSMGGSLILFAMLCLIVLLHELGHSLVAQRFGIRVLDITFWPLGGMARMSHIPENAKIEGLIAVAGPAVNFVLAALSLAALPALAWLGAEQTAFLCQGFMVVNLMLGVFNLIPAFPMDGGRVLRAFLGRKGDWLGATEKAVHVGRMLAVLMGVVGLFTGQWIVPVIAIWLWFAGGQELLAVRLRHQQSPLADLGEFVRRAFGQAAAGVPFGAPSANGTRPHAPPPHAPPPASPARARTAPEARRPSPREATPPANGGISDADIERLERFRGPLRNFGREDE